MTRARLLSFLYPALKYLNLLLIAADIFVGYFIFYILNDTPGALGQMQDWHIGPEYLWIIFTARVLTLSAFFFVRASLEKQRGMPDLAVIFFHLATGIFCVFLLLGYFTIKNYNQKFFSKPVAAVFYLNGAGVAALPKPQKQRSIYAA